MVERWGLSRWTSRSKLRCFEKGSKWDEGRREERFRGRKRDFIHRNALLDRARVHLNRNLVIQNDNKKAETLQ
jgi:hypothetical protein